MNRGVTPIDATVLVLIKAMVPAQAQVVLQGQNKPAVPVLTEAVADVT